MQRERLIEAEVYQEILKKVDKRYIVRTAYDKFDPHDIVTDAYLHTKKFFTEKEIPITYDFFKGLFWKNIARMKMTAVSGKTRAYKMYRLTDGYETKEEVENLKVELPKEFEYLNLDRYPITKMVMEGYKLDEVADKLGVVVRTVMNYKKKEQEELEVFLTSPEDKKYVLSQATKVIELSNNVDKVSFNTLRDAGKYLGVDFRQVKSKINTDQEINGYKVSYKWKLPQLDFGYCCQN